MKEVDEQYFISLKKKIERMKNQLAEARGQKKSLMKELKEKHGCGSMEKAEEVLERMTEELDSKKAVFDKKLKKLQNDYPELA